MNEIGYKLIVDKRIKRRIDILTLLLKTKQPQTIAHIAKTCHAVDRTISAEIKTMNQLLPKAVSIVSKDFEGVYLITENPFLLSDFINDQLEGNPLYEIIESMFRFEKKTLQDFSIETDISESTLRINLNVLKKVLKEYSLSLRIKPFIDIVGSEADIRFFYFQYFRHAHDSASLTPNKKRLDALHNTITQMAREFDLKLNIDYYRLSHWLLIIEQRTATNHFVSLPENLAEKHLPTFFYQKIKAAFYTQFADIISLNALSEEEFLYTFITRLDTVIYDVDINFHMFDFKKSLAQFEPIILKFFSENWLLPFVNADLRVILQAFLLNTMHLSDLTPLFQKVTSAVKQHVQEQYSETLNQWLETLSTDLMPDTLKVKYPIDLATSLTLITVAYMERYAAKKMNLLFSLTGTPSSLNYFKTRLLNIIPSGVNAHFIFNKPLTNSVLDILEIDACVYNYRLEEPITYCQSLRMSNVPNETEWLEILPQLLSKINTETRKKKNFPSN